MGSTQSRNLFKEVEFLGEDNLRSGNPDIRVNGRFVDVKTPRGYSKAKDRYKHAQEQCIAVGQKEGDILVSSLRYRGDFGEALNLAKDFQSTGAFKNVYYVVPEGEAKVL